MYVPLRSYKYTMRNQYPQRIFILPYSILLTLSMVLLSTSCRQTATPRPEGYFRIDAYPACYSPVDIGTISLHINDSAMCIIPPEENLDNALWRNIVYPRYNATIYLSYLPIDNNLDQLMAESIELVYRQNVNTDKVEAIEYESNEEQLYATLFTLSAESATPIQFIATDRSQYLLRGALYYDSTVKSDSVAPTLHYLREDIMHLIESITPATH